MAPTETLAEQHFATIQALMPGEAVPAALLTGSTTAARRADVLGKLATGELSLVVGTHALIEPDVRVRAARASRSSTSSTASACASAPRSTPRDRRGDAHPPRPAHDRHADPAHARARRARRPRPHGAARSCRAGARPIETHVASGERERARAYERIREELRAGRQAFVVCPLVEESETLQAKAARAEFERLRDTELRDFRVVLMHGQLRPREKQEAMAAFAAGGADVLVATSVIEVGIDVPNATVMLVEDAERYGISQLHQLRGRIGRGEHPSLCLLFGPKDSARLKALAAHRDGFELAQIDLELRKEGELIGGVRQHGLAQFRVAQLPDDEALLERARTRARRSSTRIPSSARPSTRCWRRRSRPPTAPRRWRPSPHEDRRRTLRRPPPDGAAPAARPARRATACARRSSSGSARSTTRACSTCSPARARSRSRRSRAAPRTPRSSTARRPRSGRSARTSPRSASRPEQAEVRRQDARAFLRSARAARHEYDLVLLDPPYRLAAELGRELSPLIAAVLAPGGRVVSESDRRAPLDLDPDLPLTDERRYGDTLIRTHERTE